MEQHYISKSYKKGQNTIILLALAFILTIVARSFTDQRSTIEMIIGMIGAFIALLAMIFAIIGTIQLIKGWKEVRNYKFFVALIGNGLGAGIAHRGLGLLLF